MVRRTLLRTMSVGARSTHGTSMRSPRQNLVSRHRCAGSQVKPDSSSTTFRSGNLVNTPSQTSDGQRCLEGRGLRGVVLGVVGRPAERRDRVAIGAAGMDADRQAVLFGRGVDRPVVTLAQRRVVHHQQQDLHEAAGRRRRG